jgi:putrescine aminotransferase
VTRFWHPFADMGQVEQNGELVLERGEGARLWDEQGRSYIDATAALWYCNVGYGREEIADAAAAQIRRIPAYSAYADLATRPAIDLADRLASLAPLDDARVFLTSGGAESIETAAKLCRRFFSLTGHPRAGRADRARARVGARVGRCARAAR